jgi:segregation and condensation protein B
VRDHYANRGVHLSVIEERWCFRTASDLASKFHIEQKVERKLTRAAIETMAIVAYHQPVTRAEIEEIRGVVISKGTLDNLLEAGWIKPKGRRQTPGRPVTWVTTEAFLEHFGLESCDALPGVEELRAAGLLDTRNNVATLGVQGTLPPNGEAGDAEDEDEDDGDERAEGLADDAYEAGVLARLEGAAAEEEDVPPGDTEGDAALDDGLTGAELPEADEAARVEAEADLAEKMEEPDLADMEADVLPDELLDDPANYEDTAEPVEEARADTRRPDHAPDNATSSHDEAADAEEEDAGEEDEAGKAS